MATKSAKAAATAVVPSAGRNLPTDWKARLATKVKKTLEQEASVATGVFLGTRAGVLTVDQQPVAGNKIEVVILDSRIENAFYDGKFDPDNPAPPICYAFGTDAKEMVPHESASQKQAASCAECEHNEFGSADEGKGKACKNIRRLALVAAKPALTIDSVLKSEMRMVKVPVTSVKGWASYARTVAALEDGDPCQVVTEISLHPDAKTQFRMSFENVGRVPDDVMPAVVQRIDTIQAQLEAPYPEAQERPEKPAKGRNAPAKRRKY